MAELNDATRDLTSAAARASLRAALADTSSHLQARAARILAHDARGFEADLAAALDGLLGRDAKADPGCRAKLVIAEALDAAEHVDGALFARGARHRQLEWVALGREDTAVGLRGRCLYALARLRHRELHAIAVDRLAAAPNAIEWANVAHALAYHGSLTGAPLLRWMVREAPHWPAGDGIDVAITSLAGYFALACDDAQELARALLAGDPEANPGDLSPTVGAEIVAQAVVESPTAEGCALLVEWLDADPGAPWCRVGYDALALVRRDDAIAYLLRTIESGAPAAAAMAVAAMAPLRENAPLVRRAREAAARNPAGDVATAVEDAFGPD